MYQFKWWIVHSLVSFWPKNGTKLVADYSTDLALFIFAANDQCYPRIPLYPSSGTSMLPRAIARQRNTPRWTAFCEIVVKLFAVVEVTSVMGRKKKKATKPWCWYPLTLYLSSCDCKNC